MLAAIGIAAPLTGSLSTVAGTSLPGGGSLVKDHGLSENSPAGPAASAATAAPKYGIKGPISPVLTSTGTTAGHASASTTVVASFIIPIHADDVGVIAEVIKLRASNRDKAVSVLRPVALKTTFAKRAPDVRVTALTRTTPTAIVAEIAGDTLGTIEGGSGREVIDKESLGGATRDGSGLLSVVAPGASLNILPS